MFKKLLILIFFSLFFINNVNANSLDDAVDYPDLGLTITSGNWVVQNDVVYFGGSALTNPSGTITADISFTKVFSENYSFIFYSNPEPGSNIQLYVDGVLKFTDSSSGWESITYNFTSGTYTIMIRSPKYGAIDYFTFTATSDTIPPNSITNLQNTTSDLWINWTWINPSDIDFNHNEIYINNTFILNNSLTYYNLTGLSDLITKTISLRSVDNTGNINSTWMNQTTTTQIIPPDTITNLQNTKSFNWINWSWINPVNIDFNHTELWLNNSFVINTSLNNYNFTNLKTHENYTLSIRTVDNSENINSTWINQTTNTTYFTIIDSHVKTFPNMTTPYVYKDKIYSEYSNNITGLSLWNSPNFVWGVYRFIEFKNTSKDIEYYKPCVLDSGNTFSCELVQNKDYNFYIKYSDLYNYNLGDNFTTQQIFITQNTITNNSIKSISNLPQKQREKTTKNNFYDAINLMIVILFFSFLFTTFSKR